MVQLPETIQNAQYSNICEICEERIRRAGKKIKDAKHRKLRETLYY